MEEPSIKDTHNKWIVWLEKQGENHIEENLEMVKPAWSKKDEEIATGIINDIQERLEDYPTEQLADIYFKEIKWLKSLKDRVQPQNNIVTDKELVQAKKDAYNETLDKIEYNDDWPTFDDGWNAAIWYLKKRNAMPTPLETE